MDMIVYKVTNIITNKIYIGITINSLKRRKWEHLSLKYSGTSILSKSIKKHGPENFTFEKIDSAENEAELIEKEKYWIKKLNTLRPNGYNALSGQVAGSELAKSRFVPIICLEDRKKYANMAEAAVTYGVPKHSVWCVCSGLTDFAGNFSFRYLSEEKYLKAEQKRSKRKSSAIAGYLYGGAKRFRKVKCLTTGEIFDSVKSAAVKFDIDPSQLVRVCKGKNKHVKNLVFAYL